MRSLYLTKSRFTLAMACPAKLYYEGKPEYANRSLEDSFLASLAEGGFQVGALARQYYQGGVEVDTLDVEDALRQTRELMARDDVIIFEAAFRHGSLLVRTDILVKQGANLELIEVKAKSFDPRTDRFYNRNGTLSSGWKSYLMDVAFQKHVLGLVLPEYRINTFLMMADKSALCPADGLNQMFRIVKDKHGRQTVSVSKDLSPRHLTPRILTAVPTDDACAVIYAQSYESEGVVFTFAQYVDYLAERRARDEKINSPPGKICGECEFQASGEELAQGVKSGFVECWTERLGWKPGDFLEQTVLDIWHFRGKDALIRAGRARMRDVLRADINPNPNPSRPGLSPSQRQWLQVEKAQSGDTRPWIDREGLAAAMGTWTFPLHFIDFETSMVAIPFHQGRRPYEAIAFQFSHHVAGKDGAVGHAGEYLNTRAGAFPNYDFIRELKRQLEGDEGSVFCYAAHEINYLNFIRQQLEEDSGDIPDRAELLGFIQSIAPSQGRGNAQELPARAMVDMLEIVKRYYYHPATRGSNSIKQVLPAVIGSSHFLQSKYAQPLYGARGGVPSLNYRDWAWVQFDTDGQVKDPYHLLPPVFSNPPGNDGKQPETNGIRDGGAALVAYARMQFEDMPPTERALINAALKRYCELDTLAMVMIYEAWVEMTARQ